MSLHFFLPISSYTQTIPSYFFDIRTKRIVKGKTRAESIRFGVICLSLDRFMNMGFRSTLLLLFSA